MKFLKPNNHENFAHGKEVFSSDKTIKLIFIPLLGVFIPNVTGLITNYAYSLPLLLVNYFCFILLAWLIWEGDVRLMVTLKNRLKIPNNEYYKSVFILLITVITYTIIISAAVLLVWHYFSKEEPSYFLPVIHSVMLVTLLAIFITNLYENFFLNREHSDTLNRVEQLDLAKTHAELVALKNQIDPHFIFNSLNTLSFLISSNPVNAKLYNDTLAKVYHYILINREKNLVLLMEEIEFMSNYFYLLKIRFDKAINMVIQITDTEAAELLILPISLQILLENVIKHNELNQEKPLTIYITVSSNYVMVKNEMNAKSYPSSTSKVGLNNLDNRYKLLTGRNIIINSNNEIFEVRLPLININ
ncbi:sensor histidine kinase [Segetibacter koreensis]|uniref:sensor histidine kinase n=1 Tax=Segetibacter koreensis TaxID=398037 RepID=UPI000365A44A|nr:histidine kinase [Segetibacter koreensis]